MDETTSVNMIALVYTCTLFIIGHIYFVADLLVTGRHHNKLGWIAVFCSVAGVYWAFQI